VERCGQPVAQEAFRQTSHLTKDGLFTACRGGEYLFPAEGCPGANSAPQSVGSNALLAGRVAPKVIAAESVEEGRPRELRCRITADRNRFNRCTILSVSPVTVRKHFQPGDPISETAVYAVVHDGHRATHQVTLRKNVREEANNAAPRPRRIGFSWRLLTARRTILQFRLGHRRVPRASPRLTCHCSFDTTGESNGHLLPCWIGARTRCGNAQGK
jgi:hypothetical protein